MDRPTSLYEPELVNRWAERYRQFETEELARQVRQMRRRMPRQVNQNQRPDEPTGRAA